jgi:glycosyltransferase involved in cell wall biosynthesis
MKNNSSVSLVIPCYNEEINIQKGVLDKIGNFTKNNPDFSEVLIVDDGSSDVSKKIIKEKYLNQFPKFKLIENQHQGKAFAIINGIKNSSGRFVMFSDIDLATPIEEADKLIQQAKSGVKIVIGSRSSQRAGAPVLRKIMAVGFILIRNLLIGLKGIQDTQCGFKLFDKKAAIAIIEKLLVFHDKRKAQGSSVTAGFDLEFLFLASKNHYSIREVPVIWKHVETKNVNFLRDSLETLSDIIKIRYLDLRGEYK